MHDGTTPEPGSGEGPAPGEDTAPPKPTREKLSERDRRRLAAIFGDALPDTTSDERDPGSASRDNRDNRDNDAWYRENRPPHHDR